MNWVGLGKSCDLRGMSTKLLREKVIIGMGFVPDPTRGHEFSKWARKLGGIFGSRGKFDQEAFQIWRHVVHHNGTSCMAFQSLPR